MSAGHYVDGELDGTVLVWEQTGQKLQMTDYAKGEPRARIGWNDTGVRTYGEVWQAGSPRSAVRMWHDSGKLRSAGELDGESFDGPWEYWHETGVRSATGRYDSGLRVGRWTCWSEDGKESLSVEYDDSGELIPGSQASVEVEPPEWARKCVNGCGVREKTTGRHGSCDTGPSGHTVAPPS
jgi:antitoxin component YwqK of YwqJK toxin-antitoxin module